MVPDWLDFTLQDASPKILELTSLQIGLDFTDIKELSRTIITNRFGVTAVLEVQLSEGSSQGYTIGFIAKQIYREESYFKYVVESSENFLNIMETRQSGWSNWKKNIDQEELKKNHFPDTLFATRLQEKNENDYIIQFDILPRYISRPKSGVSPDSRYALAGYALARMHGLKEMESLSADYSEWIPFLHSLDIDKGIIKMWNDVLESSKGGVEFGFGEYTLDSVQYNALVPGKGRLDSLCLIDPVLIPGADRCEDLGYLIYSIAEKYVENAFRKADPESISTRKILSEALDQLLVKSIPKIIQSYLLFHPKLTEYYVSNKVPIDFFAGVFLLSRSQSVDDQKMSDILGVLGTQFIETFPISEMILN
ncbi:MAG: hypothetical protein ACW981_01800 [Candidatus Hodarchaeales archaeon]|jgi:hypothetical protein